MGKLSDVEDSSHITVSSWRKTDVLSMDMPTDHRQGKEDRREKFFVTSRGEE